MTKLSEIQPGDAYAVSGTAITRACRRRAGMPTGLHRRPAEPGFLERFGLDPDTALERAERGEFMGLTGMLAVFDPGWYIARQILDAEDHGHDGHVWERSARCTVTGVREPYRKRMDGVRVEAHHLAAGGIGLLVHYSALRCTWDEHLLNEEAARLRWDERRSTSAETMSMLAERARQIRDGQ